MSPQFCNYSIAKERTVHQNKDLYFVVLYMYACADLITSICFPFSSGTNPYLTFHCVSQGTILIDLAPDDKEYQSVEEEVKIMLRNAFEMETWMC